MRYKTIIICANKQYTHDFKRALISYTGNINLVGEFVSVTDIQKIKQINPQLIIVTDELLNGEPVSEMINALQTLVMTPVIVGTYTHTESQQVYNQFNIPCFDVMAYDVETILQRTLALLSDDADIEASQGVLFGANTQNDFQDIQASLQKQHDTERKIAKKNRREEPVVNIYRTTKRQIAIYSPKGGCGKTMLAIELAHQIANQCKKLNSKNKQELAFDDKNNLKVLLVDMCTSLDTMSTTLASVRNAKVRISLLNWLDIIDKKVYATLDDKTQKEITNGEKALEECFNPQDIEFTADEVQQLLMQDKETGLYILPPIALLQELQKARPIYLDIIFSTLEKYFDVIIYDTSNNISHLTVTALRRADTVLLLTLPNLASVGTLGKVLKAFQPMQIETKKFKIITNNAHYARPLLKGEEIAATFQLDFWGEIPYEKTLIDTAEEGKAYAYRAPDKSKFKQVIADFAEKVMPLNELLNSKKKKGLFKKK